MAELSDFLSHILKEITRARMAADMEAVLVAKKYASDPEGLLQCFPVPRMRLPNIEITAPMIVTIVPEGHGEKTDPDLLSKILAADMLKMLTQHKIEINTAEIIGIIKADPSLSKGYLSQSAADALSIKIGDLVKTAASRVKDWEAIHAKVVALIREQITLTLKTLPLSAVGIGIDATTSAVREFNRTASQGTNVLFVKMSISEEALEIEFKEQPEPVSAGQPAPMPEIKRLSPE